MKSGREIEKTITITFGEGENAKTIKVSSLPEEIRNEVDTLDFYKEEQVKLTYHLEMINLAFSMKTTQIRELLKDYFGKDEKDETDEVEDEG